MTWWDVLELSSILLFWVAASAGAARDERRGRARGKLGRLPLKES